MLVFCFIMLLFLIFQNIRNVFIALCYGRKKNTSFLEVSQFLSKGKKQQLKTNKNSQIWCEIGELAHISPCFWNTHR